MTYHKRKTETEFSVIINEATHRFNIIINYPQLSTDYCEAEKVDGEQKQILCKIIKKMEINVQ